MGMDKFLGAFSLQNFLRQFFCGVVFFVPFFLYGQTPLAAWLESGQDNPDWCAPKVAALGVLACIVGTIIYHFEKNLYSYGIQCIFEWGHAKEWRCIARSIIIVIIVIIVAILAILAILVICPHYYLATLFIAISIFCLPSFYSTFCDLLHGRTRKLWVAEHICPTANSTRKLASYVTGTLSKIPSDAIPIIAERISKWSDYIHCVQSCCFAWMLSTIMAHFQAQQIIKLCSADGLDKLYDLVRNCEWRFQILIPLCILILEAIFDWHRYQHVLAITERICELPSDTQYEVTIDNLHYIVTVKQNNHETPSPQ